MAYLTATEAATRLSRFGVTTTITDGDLDAASADLDASGPWIGYRQDSTQARAFPRTLKPGGTSNTDTSGNYITAIPDAILDAVALIAYGYAEDEDPAITSESALDRSVTYSVPKANVMDRRIAALVRPYLLRAGRRA